MKICVAGCVVCVKYRAKPKNNRKHKLLRRPMRYLSDWVRYGRLFFTKAKQSFLMPVFGEINFGNFIL